MIDDLAKELLGQAMGWDPLTVEDSALFDRIQSLSLLKYDSYERFTAGNRFIQSLAQWLEQFESIEQRRVALNFIDKKLVYMSEPEMRQLVSLLYPSLIKPTIRSLVSQNLDLPEYQVTRLESSEEFKQLRRQSLFLGLSDGARIDEFRRSNRDLSHEQVYGTYEVATGRLAEMGEKLANEKPELRLSDRAGTPRFRLVFLIDDFAGSGTSIIRRDADSGDIKGRLTSFARTLKADTAAMAPVMSGESTKVYICLMVATAQAIHHIQKELMDYPDPPWASSPQVLVIQRLDADLKVSSDHDAQFVHLLDQYYNPEIEDSAKRVGGVSSKLGFGGCALPLVFGHNSPNNSVSLLWAEPPKALFPRFERHIDRRE